MNTKFLIALVVLLISGTPGALADHQRNYREDDFYSSTSQSNYNYQGNQQNIFIQNNYYYYGRSYRTRSERIYEYDGQRQSYRDYDYSTWYYYENDGDRYRGRCDRRRCDY